jgi:hypothetical protein
MYIEREVREELNKLSKEIFGVSSRWQKFLKGIPQTVTREVEEVVPAEMKTVKNEDGTETQVEVTPATTKLVQIPVPLMNKDGVPFAKSYKTTKTSTVEEVREILLNMKKQLDDLRAQMKKQQEEKEAAEAQAKAEASVREAGTGSAV